MTDDVDGTLELIRDQATRLFKHSAGPEYLKQLLEAPGRFDEANWAAATEQVWPAIAVPEAQGGIGLGWRGLCTLMEVLGAHTVALPLVSGAVAAAALLANQDHELTDRYLAALASGEAIACLALSAPIDSSLTWRQGRLTGDAGLVAFASVAQYALVSAASDGGEVMLLVDLRQPGVSREAAPTFDNGRAIAALTFDSVQAQPLRLEHAPHSRERLAGLAALATAFEQLGGAGACLHMARDYALERIAFGQPIGRFQAIKHKVAEMYVRLEIARGCALDALQALEQDDPLATALAAGARLGAIDAYEYAAQENIQIHGGLGVTWEAWPHHFYRRSRSLALELGSQQTWRNTLLRQLGFDTSEQ